MRWTSSIAAVVFTAGLAFGQTLVVKGDLASPVTLKAEDLASMPREKVNDFEGVLLRDVLKKAGAPMEGQLRGPALSTYVIARGHDGYQVIFSLGELDASFGDERIIVPDKQDGKPVQPRLVCPDDKAGSRAVKMLETLEVVRLKK
jgi:hypothetical protein